MRTFARRSPIFVLAFLVLALAAERSGAQCISLTTLGAASTQNFDTLSNTAGSTTNNLTITGWFMTESGLGARDNDQYAVDTGGSNTGDTYSYGAAGSTERALGGLLSGTLIPVFGACFTNNTGSTVTSLAISYTGEEWRLGAAARTDQINFEYSTNATDLVTGTWTPVAALNFVTPTTTPTGAKDGNAAANRTALSSTIPSLTIANGATFWIHWTDTNATGADDGLSVDDFALTPNAVPAVNLTVNDVSLNEGNGGTTSFIFTVSLSAPAGPGGVTFDIATADGTAQDDTPATEDNDYVANSLTGQTIPAGSSTYSFTVLGFSALAAFIKGYVAPESEPGGEVLYIEDSRVVAVATRRMLEKHGLTVIHCTGVEDAIAHLETMKAQGRIPGPDVVLTDVYLKGDLTGKDLLHAIRNDFHYSKGLLPALVMTGDANPANQTDLLRVGANDLVQKPIEERLLVTKLLFQLRVGRLLRQKLAK